MVAGGQEDGRELRETGPQSGARCWWPGREGPQRGDWGYPGWGAGEEQSWWKDTLSVRC